MHSMRLSAQTVCTAYGCLRKIEVVWRACRSWIVQKGRQGRRSYCTEGKRRNFVFDSSIDRSLIALSWLYGWQDVKIQLLTNFTNDGDFRGRISDSVGNERQAWHDDILPAGGSLPESETRSVRRMFKPDESCVLSLSRFTVYFQLCGVIIVVLSLSLHTIYLKLCAVIAYSSE